MRLKIDCSTKDESIIEIIHLPVKTVFGSSYKDLCRKILNEMILHDQRSPGFLTRCFERHNDYRIKDITDAPGRVILSLVLVPPAIRMLQALPSVEFTLLFPVLYDEKLPFKFMIDEDPYIDFYNINRNWHLCCELYKNGMLHVGDD